MLSAWHGIPPRGNGNGGVRNAGQLGRSKETCATNFSVESARVVLECYCAAGEAFRQICEQASKVI